MIFFESFKKQLFYLLLFVIAFVGVRSLKTGISPIKVIGAYDPFMLMVMFITCIVAMAAGIYLKLRYYQNNQ